MTFVKYTNSDTVTDPSYGGLSSTQITKWLCSLGYHAWIAVKFHYSPDVIMKKGKEKDFVMRCKYCDSSLPLVKRHAITAKTEDCLLKEKDEENE